MDEEEVQVVQPDLLHRALEGVEGVVVRVGAVVQLAGDEDVAPVETGVPDRLPDLLLVAVHLSRVDVPVSGLQGRQGGLTGFLRRDLEGAESELGDLHAVVERDGGY